MAVGAQKVRFVNKDKAKFFPVLKKRVDAYFTENNISKNANGFMVFKTIFFIGSLITLWSLVMFGGFSTGITWLLWAALGAFCAFSAVNIGHDSIHGAYSSKAKVNRLLNHSFNFLGANAYLWSIMHNQMHHTYTNVDGLDEDLESVPLLRLSPDQPLMKVHKYQWIYAWGFYTLGTLSWVFIKDYKKFYAKSIGAVVKNHPKKEEFYLYFYKAIYYALFIAVPLFVINDTVGNILLGFLFMHLVQGFTLATTFMLAHIVDEIDFPSADEKNEINLSWAEHQMHTTADFGVDSFLVGFFTGGLNFQVIHHLFPLICHVHYPAISKIVKETADEFGVPYYVNKTFIGALGSHVKLMKKLGRHERLPAKAA